MKTLSRLNSIAVFIMLAMLFTCNAQAAPHSVKLSWTAPVVPSGITITGYKVYRGTAAGSEGSTAYATVSGGSVVTFTDSAVTGGTNYFYQVTATGTCDPAVFDCSAFVAESAKSNEASSGAIPLPSAPALGAPSAAAAIVQ